jgi:hypothetical protein
MNYQRWCGSYWTAVAGSALLLCSCTHKTEPAATRPLNEAAPQLQPMSGQAGTGQWGPGGAGGAGSGLLGPTSGPGGMPGAGGGSGPGSRQAEALDPSGKPHGVSKSVPFGKPGGRSAAPDPLGPQSQKPLPPDITRPSAAGAGTGHKDPLGDASRRLTGTEQEIKVQAKPSGKGTEPEPTKDPNAKSDDVKEGPPQRTTNAPVDFKPVEASTADVERLPPEKRAAVLRYLKAVQQSQATTQRSEEK